MIIDGNEIEKAAMKEFHKGNRKEGLRIQEEFASAFREEYKEKDHCSCKKSLPLSRQLQGVRGHPPGPSGTCAKLYAPADQQKNPPAVRTDGAHHRQ